MVTAYFSTESFRKLTELKVLGQKIIEDMKVEYMESSLKGIIRDLFYAAEQEDGQYLTDDKIRMGMMDIMSAGLITSTCTLYCFLVTIAKYQRVQDKIFAEIKDCSC